MHRTLARLVAALIIAATAAISLPAVASAEETESSLESRAFPGTPGSRCPSRRRRRARTRTTGTPRSASTRPRSRHRSICSAPPTSPSATTSRCRTGPRTSGRWARPPATSAAPSRPAPSVNGTSTSSSTTSTTACRRVHHPVPLRVPRQRHRHLPEPDRHGTLAARLRRLPPAAVHVGAAPQERRNPPRGRVRGSTATGIRTPVSAVRGRRPSPLDDSGRELRRPA